MNLELFLKIVTRTNTFKKIKSGSIIPNVELLIILGSKMNVKT